MIEQLHKQADLVGAFIVGFLFSLITLIFKEISPNPIYIFLGIGLIFLAILLSKKTAHHFHDGHTHAGDSAFDIVAVLILFLVNIFHPALDGFSFYETFLNQGFLPAIIFAIGILLHEVVRQSVLATAFRNMGIKWHYVVGTAVFGIALGIVTSISSNNFFSNYEWVIDLGTLFAYSFIVSEFYFSGHFVNKKSQMGFFVVGLLTGFAISVLS